MTSQNNNVRNVRATTANRPTRQGNSNNQTNEIARGEYFGLSAEEIRILRTIKEENRQRGGFVRIFPTSDTFEFFSSFFEQRTTAFNQMIHQRLYPSRWTPNALNYQQNGGQIRRTTVPRSKHLSSAFNYGHPSDKDLTPKINGCDLDEALERYRIYERRLIDIVPPTATATTTTTNTNTINLIDPPKLNEKYLKGQIIAESNEQNSSQNQNIHRATSAPIHNLMSKQQNKNDAASKRLATVAQLVKQQQQQQVNISPAPGEGRHSIYAKNDIIQMLNQGLTLRLDLVLKFYLRKISIDILINN